jgi:hypothetical protein
MPRAITLALITLLLAFGSLWAQNGWQYDGPEDEAGDKQAVREGYMTGNRVFLYFQNTTELSSWPKAEVSRWPASWSAPKFLSTTTAFL